jgi:hypothetical protein
MNFLSIVYLEVIGVHLIVGSCGHSWLHYIPQILLTVNNASVNSSIAHPPGQPPGICTFILPGSRALVLAKLSRGRGIVSGRAFIIDSTGHFCDEHVLLY